MVQTGDNGYLKIIGRDNEVINVGGLKFMPHEVEIICLKFPGIKYAKAIGVSNPLTGQHVELVIEPYSNNIDNLELKKFINLNLPKHMRPLKIRIEELKISHRFKKL